MEPREERDGLEALQVLRAAEAQGKRLRDSPLRIPSSFTHDLLYALHERAKLMTSGGPPKSFEPKVKTPRSARLAAWREDPPPSMWWDRRGGGTRREDDPPARGLRRGGGPAAQRRFRRRRFFRDHVLGILRAREGVSRGGRIQKVPPRCHPLPRPMEPESAVSARNSAIENSATRPAFRAAPARSPLWNP